MTKTNGKKINIFDKESYRGLLETALPRIIETDDEYEETLSHIEELTFNGNKTPEQIKLLKLLVLLVEKYEEENYPLGDANPHDILNHLMESNQIRQCDLVNVIGSSGVVSEVVNGKRSISKAQAKALASFFNVSADLFI